MKAHDWSLNSWTCTECGVAFNSIEGGLACRPSTYDGGLPSDSEPPAEIDWFEINKGFS